MIIEEVLLPRCFRQSLTSGTEEQTFEREILFLQTLIGSSEIASRGDDLFELALQIAKSLECGAEQFLAGGQIVRDGVNLLRHTHVYVLDGACVEEFSKFFRVVFKWRGQSACGASPW